MVQIKSTAVALVAAAVIAPAVAYSYYPEDSIVAREDYDDYNEVLARDYGYDLEEREYEDQELALREYDDSELFERDYDDNELLERDPFLGYHHVKKWLANRKAKKLAKQQALQGGQGGGFQGGQGGGFQGGQGGGFQGAPSDPSSVDPSAREFDDEMQFEAREPEAEYEELMQRYFDDLYERELSAEFEDEIAAREFEAEDFDLVQRSPEPGFIEWIKNIFHPKKKEEKKKDADSKDAASSDAPASADSSVDAREFEDFDDLD